MKQLEAQFLQNKDLLLGKLVPSTETLADPGQIVRSIQILERIATFFPKALATESIRTIANCVRFKTHAQVRDEAANFLLSVCSDFDDAKSLLELERALPKTKDEGEPVEEDFTLNFQKEPKKSQKQLMKLIQMLKTHIMPHEEFI